MSLLWELEDYLQNANVFISGINGRVTHMDSYMTVMDFEAFDKAMEKVPFTKNQLMEAAWQMNYHSYLSPMAGLASALIQNKLCPAFSPLVTLARTQEKIIKGSLTCQHP